ncbi:MAG: ABC transporter ATP-binding protein [Verrucomicrobia bacterium]|nr:ABC transporter ATP-binding protein [Verrucomicrobiota bacterium]
MAQVGLEHLTKVFKGPGGDSIRAVDGACLVVEDREFLALVGPSGCGKTTTLRLIAGLEEPTAGAVSLNGRIVNDLPPKDRDLAMVFQNHALYPHMSVYENMAFGLKLRHYPKAEITQRVKDAAQILNLTGLLDRKPAALSGGERQRVALGRAIVRRPGVFLLDEPLSNLDAQTRLQMRAEISRLHARVGSTMIYVTHDQAEALTLGHRVAVMKDGVIQQIAAPMDLYDHPANLFVAGFIGSPPMNLFDGKVSEREQVLCFQEDQSHNARLPNPITAILDDASAPSLRSYLGRKIIFGIRPEHIACRSPLTDTLQGSAVEAVVELVQPLGSETYLHFASHARSFVARVRPSDDFSVNQKVSLVFDVRQAHFFDPASGLAIV